DSMTVYNAAGRSFYVEAYGGRPYRVERQKCLEAIDVRYHVVAAYGGTQADKLALLMRDPDDGLLARILWACPEPSPVRLGPETPRVDGSLNAVDGLRELDLQPGPPPQPIKVRLVAGALSALEAFGREMQRRQKDASGLLRSAYGKARGQALRLSLNLEFLWW